MSTTVLKSTLRKSREMVHNDFLLFFFLVVISFGHPSEVLCVDQGLEIAICDIMFSIP